MRPCLTTLGLLIALSAGWPEARADDSPLQGAVRVDGLAAVVGGMAPGPGVLSILRSDVELRARIALAGSGAGQAALGALPARLLGAMLDELLGEALIASEASRLALEPPNAAALRREALRFETAAGGQARLLALCDTLGVQRSELDGIVRRRAIVSAFLNANLEGTLEITPAELERAYADDHPFRDRPPEQAREPLRQWLTQRRLEKAVKRWVESLRQRTPHRVLVTY